MRAGFNSLAPKVQTLPERAPFNGHVFVFRDKRCDLFEGSAVERRGNVSAHTVVREGTLRLATGNERYGVPESHTALDASRRHRLAPADTYCAASIGVVSLGAGA